MAASVRKLTEYEDRWSELFDELVKIFSSGEYEQEVIEARNVFFDKLGRSHEMKEDFFEAVSQSFLEWYIFNYSLSSHQKTPAIVFVGLGWGEDWQRDLLHQYLFQHWSIFEVVQRLSDEIHLQDLLFEQSRRLRYKKDDETRLLWKVQPGQIIQARLFPNEKGLLWTSHIWLHPESEKSRLKGMCSNLSKDWSLHHGFLRESFECLLRTLSLQDQLAAVRTQNFIYVELTKKYAKA